MLSDFINDSDSEDYLRGWSLVLFSMAITLVLVANFRNNDNAIFFFLVTSIIVNIFITGDPIDLGVLQEETNYFKSRVVSFLNPAVMLLSLYFWKKNKIKVVFYLFLAYTALSFIFDARSNGIIYFISLVLLLIKVSNYKLKSSEKLFLFISILVVFYSFYVIYIYQILNYGFGGTNSKVQVAMMSNPYNPFELLYYGRTDFVALYNAIADNPFTGYGSWGKDKLGLYSVNYVLGQSSLSTDLTYISPHSVILASWVWSGALGCISIAYMYFRLFKMVIQIYSRESMSQYLPIILILSIDMLWAFFFSPIGLLRSTFPIFASIIIVEYNKEDF